MHTKLNNQQNDPNFLTRVTWFKTSLVAAHTPRTIMELEL
jgi:hypothetical protein